MPDSDLKITIAADASGVGQGTDQAKSAIAGLSATLSGVQASFSAFSAAVGKAFVAPNVGGVTGAMAQVRTSCADLAAAMGQAGVSVRGWAAQSQSAQTQALQEGADVRELTTQILNERITASNATVVTAYAAGQQQQTAAAESAGKAKAAASDESTRHIIGNDRKVLTALKSSIDSMVASFSKGMLQMAEGSKSFGQVMRTLGQQLLNDMLRIVDSIIDKWVWGETEKVLASTQGQQFLQALGLKDLAQQMLVDTRKTASSVTSAAAQKTAVAASQATGVAQEAGSSAAERAINAQTAFSGAIAAISPIPLIGPFIAPGIAAEMASLASAAGGYDIPSGVNPLTQLHQQEMVLPARLANPMRDMLAGYSSGAGAAAGHTINFGDFTVHGGPSGMSSGEFRQALTDHASHVAGAVAGALRNGYQPPYKQPTNRL